MIGKAEGSVNFAASAEDRRGGVEGVSLFHCAGSDGLVALAGDMDEERSADRGDVGALKTGE